MYKVTPQQRANLLHARERWLVTPPEQVVPGLEYWRRDQLPNSPVCGTLACFGGHVALDPYFQKLGVIADRTGAPGFNKDIETTVAERLFGDGVDWLFDARDDVLDYGDGDFIYDGDPKGISDHAVVLHRIDWLLAHSEVQES